MSRLLEAEQNIARRRLNFLHGNIRSIAQELSEANCKDIQEPASIISPWCYRLVNVPGLPLPILSRSKPVQIDSWLECTARQEQIVLDLNRLPHLESGGIAAILKISPDHQKIALATQADGQTQEKLQIVDWRRNEITEVARGWFYALEWGRSADELFFASGDSFASRDSGRANLISQVILSAGTLTTKPIHIEPHAQSHLSMRRSAAGDQLLVLSRTPDWAELKSYALPKDSEYFAIQQVAQIKIDAPLIAAEALGEGAIFVAAPHHDGGTQLAYYAPVLSSNNFHLKQQATVNFEVEEIQSHAGQVLIEGARQTLPTLLLLTLADWNLKQLSLPGENITSVRLLTQPSNDNSAWRLSVRSLVEPDKEIWINSKGAVVRSIAATCESGAYKLALKRELVRSADGTKIPLTLLGSRESLTNPNSAVFLKTYGAYGISSELHFEPSLLPILRRGIVIGFAHIRGGGELGLSAARSARKSGRHLSVEDLIATAEYLKGANKSRRRLIALHGRSAAAVPIIAAIAERSQLFSAAVIDSPLLDLKAAVSDPNLPNIDRERAEWGDPGNPHDSEAIDRYSPLMRDISNSRTSILLTQGLHDTVTPISGTAEWIRRQRKKGMPADRLLLRLFESGGHGGPQDYSENLQLDAIKIAFLLDAFGIE